MLCEQVRRYLAAYMRTAGIAYASACGCGTRGAGTALPNRHGMDSDSGYEVAAARVLATRRLLSRDRRSHRVRRRHDADGQRCQHRQEYAQIDIGYRDHWLSPLTDSAMLLGTEAATMPSVTVSNYAPISRCEAALRAVHRAR